VNERWALRFKRQHWPQTRYRDVTVVHSALCIFCAGWSLALMMVTVRERTVWLLLRFSLLSVRLFRVTVFRKLLLSCFSLNIRENILVSFQPLAALCLHTRVIAVDYVSLSRLRFSTMIKNLSTPYTHAFCRQGRTQLVKLGGRFQ